MSNNNDLTHSYFLVMVGLISSHFKKYLSEKIMKITLDDNVYFMERKQDSYEWRNNDLGCTLEKDMQYPQHLQLTYNNESYYLIKFFAWEGNSTNLTIRNEPIIPSGQLFYDLEYNNDKVTYDQFLKNIQLGTWTRTEEKQNSICSTIGINITLTEENLILEYAPIEFEHYDIYKLYSKPQLSPDKWNLMIFTKKDFINIMKYYEHINIYNTDPTNEQREIAENYLYYTYLNGSYIELDDKYLKWDMQYYLFPIIVFAKRRE